MKVDLPVNVMLRCREIACVEQRVTLPLAPFRLQGRTKDGMPELWMRCGHWHEDRTPHPRDIVGLVAADGQLVPLSDQFSRK